MSVGRVELCLNNFSRTGERWMVLSFMVSVEIQNKIEKFKKELSCS